MFNFDLVFGLLVLAFIAVLAGSTKLARAFMAAAKLIALIIVTLIDVGTDVLMGRFVQPRTRSAAAHAFMML